MQYEEIIQYLFTHLPMYQRIGQAAYKKDLKNTTLLLAFLNNPQDRFKSIHVGGTNGKGSVSNMLSSVLQEAGYKVGLYTSPHLIDFRERIRINGNMCSKEFVVAFVERIKPQIEIIQPSFFEITVAMAFEYFATNKVDCAIIEVGLGGRLDSTNVIAPILSVVTNISLDHTNLLGNSIQEIAQEKAGIIKPNTPIIIGEFHTESYSVFMHQSASLNAPIYLAEQNFELETLEHSFTGITFHATYFEQLIYSNLFCQLAGNYQIKNVKTVLQCIEILRKLRIEISDENVYDGFANILTNTRFKGRTQLVKTNPNILIDCAHNEAGLFEIFSYIEKLDFSKLHIVTGMVNDKEIGAHLKHFPKTATYYFCKPNIPRGRNEQELFLEAKSLQLYGEVFKSVQDAILKAIQKSNQTDLILVCGSIFVAAEALEYFETELKKN